ncbi:MAG: SRPBCC family protein [Candidatus Marinimicrobia bacterium]|jgi:hypothetical protein|nr:SRPBCC family protein [Candidatus Neomarinimicrobiota bacterium]MBT3937571.1 SRPBCC family protein [Candidatus Neomarinimicrobiota bacterium]MBT3960722.1 SRPBCC family protein [Candidatus Neomarinimicrobiota bacterium]MBT4382912.1 SRPBCC family protein [Candidatus Neomarinimicrobiota bacterium]MBT4635112.1 SRPBCC family protein [Candidatus Neomarinimicrobiota bacterium]
MKIYKITTKQIIKRPLVEIFAFFSRPENLSLITPDHLDFKILTPPPIEMKKGALIDYIIRIFKAPIHWQTLITSYEPPYKFVDKQIKGPYKYWHHTHTFVEGSDGVEIHDEIQYSVPFGIIGKLLHAIWIKNNLNYIFEYRREVIHNLFNSKDYHNFLLSLNQVTAI